MGQHYEEQILQFESQNDFQTGAVAEKLYQIEKIKTTANYVSILIKPC